MTGLNMQEFKEALKGNREIEFMYNGNGFVIQPELRGASVYLVIWQTGDNAACIAEKKIANNGQITDEDIDFLLNQKCFGGRSFLDVEQNMVVSLVY